MSDLKLFDTVGVPGEYLRSNIQRPGVISFISECGKYCKVRFSKGKKVFTQDYKLEDLKKQEA